MSLFPSPATIAARSMTSTASSVLREPLLDKEKTPTQVTVRTGEAEDDSSNGEKMKKGNIFMTSLVCLMAAGGFAASTVAMVSIQTIIVIAAGGICCLNAPTVIARQYQISSFPDLRNSIGLLRSEVNVLSESIDFLKQTVIRLYDEVDDLNIVENELANIVATQGSNAISFAALVKENEEILDAMKLNLRETFVSELAKIIMRADRDGDMKIDDREWPSLALSLKIQLEPYGIDLDTDLFSKMLAEDNDIGNILKFCAEVLYPGMQDDQTSLAEESFGELSDDDEFMVSMGYGGGQTPSFSEFCGTLSAMNDEELNREVSKVGRGKRMSTAEKMEMFTIKEAFSRGSVEVCRGARMSVFPGAQVRKKRYSRLNKIAGEAEKRCSHARKTVMKIEKKRATLVRGGRVRSMEN